MQFERIQDGSLKPLPAKHVDTGAGLERITSVLQSKFSNYDSDLFTPLMERIQAITGAPAYEGKVGADDVTQVSTAYRVVADHVRTLTFAITDGGLPSSQGRGYVVRRVLRRALRYFSEVLGGKIDEFHTLVDVVVENYGSAFPEIIKNASQVKDVIIAEAVKFGRTLDRGVTLFKREAERAATAPNSILSGDVVFKLYDTYGFPTDLTKLMAEERGLRIDEEAFKAAQAEAVRRSSAVKINDKLRIDTDTIDRFSSRGRTDDSAKYGESELDARVLGVFDYTGKVFVESASTVDATLAVLTDVTCFYAEQGGQAADSGVAIGVDGSDLRFEIVDVQTYAGCVIHYGMLRSGVLATGAAVRLQRDETRRQPIAVNHTATHLLNFGLLSVLGGDVGQRGSAVDEDKLRFDFNSGPVPPEQLASIEAVVNGVVSAAKPVFVSTVPLSEALQINGLRHMAGEAYPQQVRVVSVGVPVDNLLANPKAPEWASGSIEFCGGTHIANSREIEMFAIVGEEAVGGGVRRITAICGDRAREAQRAADDLNAELAAAASLSGSELDAAVRRLNNEISHAVISLGHKAQMRHVLNTLLTLVKEEAKKAAAANADIGAALLAEFANAPDTRTIVRVLNGGADKNAIKTTKKVGETLLVSCPQAAVLLVCTGEGGKSAYHVLVPQARASPNFNAKTWAAAVAELVNGKGGGSETVAQGNTTGVDWNDALLARIAAFADA